MCNSKTKSGDEKREKEGKKKEDGNEGSEFFDGDCQKKKRNEGKRLGEKSGHCLEGVTGKQKNKMQTLTLIFIVRCALMTWVRVVHSP